MQPDLTLNLRMPDAVAAFQPLQPQLDAGASSPAQSPAFRNEYRSVLQAAMAPAGAGLGQPERHESLRRSESLSVTPARVPERSVEQPLLCASEAHEQDGLAVGMDRLVLDEETPSGNDVLPRGKQWPLVLSAPDFEPTQAIHQVPADVGLSESALPAEDVPVVIARNDIYNPQQPPPDVRPTLHAGSLTEVYADPGIARQESSRPGPAHIDGGTVDSLRNMPVGDMAGVQAQPADSRDDKAPDAAALSVSTMSMASHRSMQPGASDHATVPGQMIPVVAADEGRQHSAAQRPLQVEAGSQGLLAGSPGPQTTVQISPAQRLNPPLAVPPQFDAAVTSSGTTLKPSQVSEGFAPQLPQSEAFESDRIRVDVARLQMARGESARGELARSEAVRPEMISSDATKPNRLRVDSAGSENLRFGVQADFAAQAQRPFAARQEPAMNNRIWQPYNFASAQPQGLDRPVPPTGARMAPVVSGQLQSVRWQSASARAHASVAAATIESGSRASASVAAAVPAAAQAEQGSALLATAVPMASNTPMPEPSPTLMVRAGTMSQNFTGAPEDARQQLQAVVRDQIMGALTRRALQQGRISLQLSPRELGTLDLDISMDANETKVAIVAREVVTRDLIEAGFTRLRQSLHDEGLNVAALEVSLPAPEQHQERGRGGANTRDDERNSRMSLGTVAADITGDATLDQSVSHADGSGFYAFA